MIEYFYCFPIIMKNILAILLLISSTASAQLVYNATTAEERQAGELRRKQLESRSLIGKLPLRSVGPTITSGRAIDLDANPENPAEFYVAYASGGLWYTRNNGQSFTCISDNLPHTFTGDVAVNWKEKTVWLGTGEPNSLRSSYAGTGVYKTRDNGKTWEHLGLPESHRIGKVELHPTDNNIAWVAAVGHLYTNNKERGIYLTKDGGKTWKQTLYVNDSTGGIDVVADPVNPAVVYAAMWQKGRKAWNLLESGKGSGIYKSVDGGETWTLITTAASGFPTGDVVGRIGLAVYSKNPNVLYAVVDHFKNRPDTVTRRSSAAVYALEDFRELTKEQFGRLDERKLDSFLSSRRLEQYKAAEIKRKVASGEYKPTVIADYFGDPEATVNVIGAEVYRSNDAGKTWKRTHDQYLDIFSSYGYVFARIWISPNNPDKIITVGVPLLLSENGGKTFRDIGKANVHVDHHAFWFNPKDDNHFINGNDGGVNISYDNGDNWFKANTPAVSQFFSIEVDNAQPYNVYGGMQDNGVWYGPSNYVAGPSWYANGQYPYKSIGGGDGMHVQVDWRDNNTFYTGSQFGAYSRATLDGKGARLPVRPSIQLGEKPLRFNWLTPILLSRHNQDILYYGSNRFHRSMNKGEKMENLSGDLTNGGIKGDVPYGTLTTLSESPLRFGLIYAGSDDGNLHVTKDGGYSWTKISGKLPQGLWVSRVTASAYKEGRVYVSLTGYRFDHFAPYLFVSEDYGNNWKAFGNTLPMEPVNIIKEDPKKDAILYVGTDNGLYVSLDRGASFMAWTGGLPRVPVYDLAIQPRDNEIAIGTHGRSIYIGKLGSIQQLTSETISKPLTIMEVIVPQAPAGFAGRRRGGGNQTPIQLTYFVKEPGEITITLRSAESTIVTMKEQAATGINFTAISRELPAGKYSFELTGRTGVKSEKQFEVKR
jgi:photosystem II stability/assembly factor-like uncharacterized protein